MIAVDHVYGIKHFPDLAAATGAPEVLSMARNLPSTLMCSVMLGTTQEDMQYSKGCTKGLD